MPIYSYKCNACGHQSDVLQKISDEPLTKCPACGKDSYSKQLTAAGFVLKGGGWYVTDFKDQKGKGQDKKQNTQGEKKSGCLLYTSPSPRDREKSRMPSSA